MITFTSRRFYACGDGVGPIITLAIPAQGAGKG